MPHGTVFVTDEGYLKYQGITGVSGVGIIAFPDGSLNATGVTGHQGSPGITGTIGPIGPTGFVVTNLYGNGSDGNLTINTGYLPKPLIRVNNLTIGTGTVRPPSGCNGAVILVKNLMIIASGGSLNSNGLGGVGALGAAVVGGGGNGADGDSIATNISTHLNPTGGVATGALGGFGGVSGIQTGGNVASGHGGVGGTFINARPTFFMGGAGGGGGGGGYNSNIISKGFDGGMGGNQESPRVQYNYQKDNAIKIQPLSIPTFTSSVVGMIPGAGGAGGGGGGNGGAVAGAFGLGGAGGTGGDGGGWLWVAAKQIQNNGVITVNGTDGAWGGTGGTGSNLGASHGGGGAGGGGGGGGGGGMLVVHYSVGSVGTCIALPGAGGIGGYPGVGKNSGKPGGTGSPGENGSTGMVRIVQVL